MLKGKLLLKFPSTVVLAVGTTVPPAAVTVTAPRTPSAAVMSWAVRGGVVRLEFERRVARGDERVVGAGGGAEHPGVVGPARRRREAQPLVEVGRPAGRGGDHVAGRVLQLQANRRRRVQPDGDIARGGVGGADVEQAVAVDVGDRGGVRVGARAEGERGTERAVAVARQDARSWRC